MRGSRGSKKPSARTLPGAARCAEQEGQRAVPRYAVHLPARGAEIRGASCSRPKAKGPLRPSAQIRPPSVPAFRVAAKKAGGGALCGWWVV